MTDETDVIELTEPQKQKLQLYAVKFLIDTKDGTTPTDERFNEVFAGCVRRPKIAWLPVIRDHVIRLRSEREDTE